MKLLRFAFFAVSVLLFSCKQNSSDSFSEYLNPAALPAQTFEFNINRDTTLVTKGKCIIKIPAGSIESDQPNVKLEIKEALNNTDIVLAGLTTMSGGKVLSSGGMLKIDVAQGYKASIKKPLEALIPTKDYNADMSVYKGVEKDGKIDWVDPEPLPNDSLQMIIKEGKALFTANCASCHKIDKDVVAPALKGITQRRPLMWICNFTHNPAGMISNDPYSKQLAEKWKPTVMTAFPVLENSALYAILAYIETKGGMKGPDFVKSLAGQTACADSCEKYILALQNISQLQNEIDINQEDFFTLEREIPIPPTSESFPADSIKTEPVAVTKPWVSPTVVKAAFYTVNINSFGWYNVDVLCNTEGTEKSELSVSLQNPPENDARVMLIIPSLKAFIEGGKLEDGKQYGFRETDGSIPLPPNVPCTVIAFAESNGKLVFGKSDFISSPKQTINISLAETTKEGLTAQIKALKLDGITTEVKDSKNSDNLHLLEKNRAEAEKLKPKNCECDIPATQAPISTDSLKSP